MNKPIQAALEQQVSTAKGVLYMAIEMGDKKWKLGFSTGEAKSNGEIKVHEKVIVGNDYLALSEAIGKAKERFELDTGCRVVSCYEAVSDLLSTAFPGQIDRSNLSKLNVSGQ